MDDAIINSIFTPKPTRQETKAEITSRVARDIMDKEATARDAKSTRLRAARLEREAALALEAAKPSKKKPVQAGVRKSDAKAGAATKA